MKKGIDFISIFKKKIFRSIFFSFSGSILILIIIYGALTFPMQKQSLIEVMHSEAYTLSNSISLACESAMVDEDDSFIVEHNMAVINKASNISSIIIKNKNGTILKSEKDTWSMPESLSPLLKQFEQKDKIYKIIYLDDEKKDLFHYAMPIVISGVDWGWIHVDFSLEQYNKNMESISLFLLYLTICSMIVALFISYFLAKYILTPILELTEVAKEVSSGNLKVRSDIKREDEIGNFAKDFNIMIHNLALSKEVIKKSNDKLEEKVLERTSALAKKSLELEELNKTLDIRVQQEIQKSRKSEQLLIQQSRQAAMGDMIGNIAHQWRQPLNALGLVTQNIYFDYQMNMLNDNSMEKFVGKSTKLIESMSKTIDDFRNFFKPNKLKENFIITDVINNTIELIESSYKNNNIEIKTDLDDNSEFNSYSSEFSQVILNILSNSKDALIDNRDDTRIVQITSQVEDASIIINISDNAGGIPDDVIQKIFDPYFTTKEEGKGTGIGLYMSKTIIETNMGGKISVKNNNEGAIFTIILKAEDT